MGTSHSKTEGRVLAPHQQVPPQQQGPPYPGPPVEYNFINTQVTMTGNVTFSPSNSMITTNIDSYYPILGQKYAEGFHLLTFYRIPGGAQRNGLFSTSVNIPFQGVFCRSPYIDNREGWQLRVVKSMMVSQLMGHGLIRLNHQMVGDTSHIYNAILEHTQTGGRLICVEMTGQQRGQQLSAAMQGTSPFMGVDLFFEVPTNPSGERYLYQSVPVPVHLQTKMSFGSSGVIVTCDWQGVLGSQLSQGWRLVEIFYDLGVTQHGAFSTSCSQNSIWFFEKPASRAEDNTPVYQGTVVEHYIKISQGFSGAHTDTGWEPVCQQLGAQGWELACIVETPEVKMTGIGSAKMKVLLFFQRRILPAVGDGGPGVAAAPPQAGVMYGQDEKPPPSY